MPIDKSKLRKETREEAMYSFNNPLVWLGRTMEDEPFKSDKPLKFINPPKPPKITKDKNIMKARSDIKNKDGKISIDTEMNITKGLEPKVKRALKKSVIGELDKKIDGSGIRNIDFELSSDDEKPKKIKGKGVSTTDNDNIKIFTKLLKHLVEHINNPDEKIDDKDIKQSIEIIRKIKDIKDKKMVYNDSSSDSSSEDEIEGKGNIFSTKKISPEPIPTERLRKVVARQSGSLLTPKMVERIAKQSLIRSLYEAEHPELSEEEIDKKAKRTSTKKAVQRAAEMATLANMEGDGVFKKIKSVKKYMK
jgi:hypothetical protein